MPWKEANVISLRKEFIQLAKNGSNISRLCENFGISRKTGYKWIERHRSSGEMALADRSRRPVNSPKQVCKEIEEVVVMLRKEHPAWGGRKIKRRLQNLGHRDVPAASTITSILRRNGFIDRLESEKHLAFERFQRKEPNDLWQMDFKGHVACPEGRCHPLTILDDCSRYALAIKACLDERTQTVQSCLQETFRRYGLPNQIITDNGAPWGNDASNPYTRLTVWLMRLGILISHSRPAHPQTLGKDERFHRTFKAELLGDSLPWPNDEAQQRFESWRIIYNYQRPHEALGMEVPANYYRISNRTFSERLESIEYGPSDIVRKVQQKGIIHFHGREFRVPQALIGQPIALRPRAQSDGSFEIYYVRQLICVIDLKHHD
jgi:transposase InsO family protein